MAPRYQKGDTAAERSAGTSIAITWCWVSAMPTLPRPEHHRRPGRSRSLFVLVIAALGSCRIDPTTRCRTLVKEQRFREALVACEDAWARARSPLAAAGAASAQAAVRNDLGAAVTWAERLAGTPQEPEALLALGRVRSRAGQSAEARATFERVVALAQAVGDHPRSAAAAYELFLAAVRETRYLDALAAMDVAEEERRAGGLEQLRPIFLASLFDLLYEVGDIDTARRVLAEASALANPADPDQMRYLRARQALVHHADGAWALERQAHLETLALNLESKTPVPDLTWSTLLNLLELATERGDLAEARSYLERAQELRRGSGQPTRGQIALLRRRAIVERAAGHRKEATRLTAAAQALHPTDQVAWQLATDEGELAEEEGDDGRAEESYESAIAILDRMSAAFLGSELQQWSLAKKRRPFARLFALHARRGEADQALAVWDRFQRRAFVQGFVRTSSPVGGPPGTEPRRSRARLAALSQILPAIDASPLAALPPAGRRTLPPRLSGLFYFEGGSNLYVLVVGGGAVTVRRIARAAEDLERLIARFVADPDDRVAATELGDVLVPQLPVLPSDGVLHVCAARLLAEVPFAALRVRGRLLVEHAALISLPSLGVLERAPSVASGPPLVLADPLGDLPQARAEALQTAALVHGEALVGARASASRLEQAAQASVIHFATHSGFGQTGPWLQLADRRLLATDLLRLGLRPRTVVLPTCSSAVGAAPGVSTSLAASFLAAGASMVVGALRSVDDLVSRRFMLDFYAAGGAGDPAAAVAQVQRRWSRDRPAVEWASFVVLGGSPSSAPDCPPPAPRAVTSAQRCRLMTSQTTSTEGRPR
jgi:tetratricopeptide (TPR) repeat protein